LALNKKKMLKINKNRFFIILFFWKNLVQVQITADHIAEREAHAVVVELARVGLLPGAAKAPALVVRSCGLIILAFFLKFTDFLFNKIYNNIKLNF
jgi:hypothetical protein